MTTNKDFDNFLKFIEEKKKIETEDGTSVADKLNPFLAPGSRDIKTGEYKPKDPDVEYGKKDLAADLASVGPPVTSIPGAAYGTYRSLQRGEYGQAALNALGVIPGVGLLTKGTKLAGTGEKIAKVAGHADVAGSLGSIGKDVYDATKDNEPKPIQPSTPSEPKKVKPINIPNEPTSTKIEPRKVQPIKIQPESGGKIKMTDKKKSISEALAEVQRNAELKKIQEAKNVWGDALDENILMERGSSRAKFFNNPKDWFKGKNTDVNPPSGRPGDNAKDITGKAKEIKPDTTKGKTEIKPVETPAPKAGSGIAGKLSTGLSGLALGGIAAAGLLGAGKKTDEPAAGKIADEPEKPKDSPKSDDMTFGQAFAAARKAATEKGAKSTGQFSWHGKDYQTNIQGKGTPKAPEEKYVAPSKQTKVDIGTKASAPAAETPAAAPTPTPPKQSSGDSYTNGREPGWRDTPPQPASPAPNAFQGSTKDTTPIGPDPTKFTKPESESGGKKKKMSEETNPLIAAFLKLQENNPQNMFEAAKKAKKDYDKDGKIESPKDEVWGSRFRAAKAAGKMEEGALDPNDSDVTAASKTITKKPYVDPSTPTEPYKKAPMSTGAGDVLNKASDAVFNKKGIKEAYMAVLEAKKAKARTEDGYDRYGNLKNPEDRYDDNNERIPATNSRRSSSDDETNDIIKGSAPMKGLQNAGGYGAGEASDPGGRKSSEINDMLKGSAPIKGLVHSGGYGAGEASDPGGRQSAEINDVIQKSAPIKGLVHSGGYDAVQRGEHLYKYNLSTGEKIPGGNAEMPAGWSPKTSGKSNWEKSKEWEPTPTTSKADAEKQQKWDAYKKTLKPLPKDMPEEVEFSQAEIDHLNSFFLEASVAPNRPEVAAGADSVSDKMSQNDVTGTSTESGGKKKVKEEVELEEGDLTIRTLYNKWAGHASGYHEKSGAKANAVEKAITKVHGPKVMSHLKKALNANLQGNFDRENSHFEKARTAAGKSEMIGATVGSGRSEFRKTNEETLQEGRPKKNPEPESTERDPRKHIQVEAGRAAAGNVIDFHHNDGTKSKITPAMGRRITSHLNSLKPADRQAAVNKMHDSAEGLKV